MRPSVKLSRLTTLEELDDLAEEWDMLLTHAEVDNVFFTRSWLSEWWRV